MKKIFLAVLLMLAINSCKNDESFPIYTGEVRGQTTDCSGLPGTPIIIEVYDSTAYDLIYTLTLPSQYWTKGTKITFKMRPFRDGDTPMICNATVFGVKQMVVFDVTGQEIN